MTRTLQVVSVGKSASSAELEGTTTHTRPRSRFVQTSSGGARLYAQGPEELM